MAVVSGGGGYACYTAPLQTFGHPGEAWGYAVGSGAKFVNFLLPKDMIEFQVNYCHGATAYCFIPGLYSWNWIYGGGNTVGQGFAVDGVFNNGGQIQLSDTFSYSIGYQHYWSPQWRTAVVGGQTYATSTTAVPRPSFAGRLRAAPLRKTPASRWVRYTAAAARTSRRLRSAHVLPGTRIRSWKSVLI